MSLIDYDFMQRYQGKLDTAIKDYVQGKDITQEGIELQQNIDLDNLKTTGNYLVPSDSVASNIANIPLPLSGKIIVIDSGSNAFIQFYISNHTPRLFERTFLSNAWSSWREYGEGGGGGGTTDYSDLTNKPSINGVTLSGNKTTSDLGLASEPIYLTQTLTAGQTTVTFTSAQITATSMVDVYTSVAGLGYISMTGSVGTITVTYEAQQSDITVVLEIKPQPTV